ncbi:MAG: hypothetical protein NT001_00535 [Candidatus Woesearchaeota archaeon]|nr:hypothetical protein [Candidatus Woesearchaeota archaeon]
MSSMRGFLKTAGIGGMALVLGIGAFEADQRTGFNSLWNQTIELVESYNDYKLGRGSKGNYVSEWKELVEKGKGLGVDLNDMSSAEEFYRMHGKVCVGTNVDQGRVKAAEYILGDIEKQWYEDDTDIVLFSQSIDTLINEEGYPDIPAFLHKETNTAFINLTQIKKDSRITYERGQEGGDDAFQNAMYQEFYQKMMKIAKEKHPALSLFCPYKAFEKEFTIFMIRSLKLHEKLHKKFPEGGKGEFETYLRQIASEPELNSYFFTIATPDLNPSLYGYFRNKEVTEKDLMKMSSEDRARICNRS